VWYVSCSEVDVAKSFVRALLKKEPQLRLAAVEALSHPFMAESKDELSRLYEETVIFPRTTMKKEEVTLTVLARDEIYICPDDENDPGNLVEDKSLNTLDGGGILNILGLDEIGRSMGASSNALKDATWNLSEMVERKRVWADGKENESPDDEDELRYRKRRCVKDI